MLCLGGHDHGIITRGQASTSPDHEKGSRHQNLKAQSGEKIPKVGQ
jgi:hypothetical protein